MNRSAAPTTLPTSAPATLPTSAPATLRASAPALLLASAGFALLLSLTLPGTALAQSCPNDCSGNGLCLLDTCICGVGWAGDDCSLAEGSVPCPNDCSGNGVCEAGACTCDAGFEGDACEVATLPPADGMLTGTWVVKSGFCKEVDAAAGRTRYVSRKGLAERGMVQLLLSHRGDVADGFFAGMPFVGLVTAQGRHGAVMAGAVCSDVPANPASFLEVLDVSKAHHGFRWRRHARKPRMHVRFVEGDASVYRSCWLRLKRVEDADPAVPMCPFGP